MKISKGSRVEIHYRLFDPEGEMVETTEPDDPVLYVHGEEEILPGLENALEGCEAGGDFRVELEAEQAYGEYNPEGLVYVPRSELPDDLELKKGEWIAVGVEDDEEADDEDEMEMRVVEVHEDEVVLDANHPLAGKRVTFEVRVISVLPA